jgi:transcriptional regulator with XRE-family HTH domain
MNADENGAVVKRSPLGVPFDPVRLRLWRVARGLSQEELADRCREQGTAVSRFQVVRAERGVVRPQWQVLTAFAVALGVSLEDLAPEELCPRCGSAWSGFCTG